MSISYVNRKNDEEIIDIMRSIFNHGSFEIETYYEGVLVGLMAERGTPIYHDDGRDPMKDLEMWRNED